MATLANTFICDNDILVYELITLEVSIATDDCPVFKIELESISILYRVDRIIYSIHQISVLHLYKLKYVRCVQKVSRLNFYLLIQK